jgi:competence protein ComEC
MMLGDERFFASLIAVHDELRLTGSFKRMQRPRRSVYSLRTHDLLAVMAGVIFSLGLPDPLWGLTASGFLPALLYWRQITLACGFLGFFLGSLSGLIWLETRLPEECFGREVEVTGRIDSLPRTEPAPWGGWRVTAELEVLALSDKQCREPRRILLRQHLDTPELDAAMRYGVLLSGPIRLKALTSQWNPGVLPDQARWVSRGLDAAAVVAGPIIQSADDDWLVDFRVGFIDEWAEREGQGWVVLRALLLGDTRGMSPALWADLKRLGIVHLVVISDLHIALLAGLASRLAQLPRRLWKLPRDRGTDRLTTVSTLLVSGLYVVLIGAPLPAQRAFFMLCAVKVPCLLGWSSENRRSLLLTLTFMLLWEPKIALGASFWLSAMATWILVTGPAKAESFSGLFCLQVKIVFLMAPMTLFWFGEASWLGVLANIVMVPAVTLVMVPAGFAGALLSASMPALSAYFLALSVGTWDLLMPAVIAVLERCNLCDLIYQPLPLAGFILAVIGVVLWSSHRRFALLAYFIALVLAIPGQRPPRESVVTFLDVGQGLGVIIESDGRVLVYDTGDGFPDSFSQAEKTIWPYLQSRGVETIDVLVVSHADRDHSGGLAFLSDQMPVNRHLGFGGEPCRNGERWQWGRAEILIVNGPGHSRVETNDLSCGFLLTIDDYRILALGDISAGQEREVVRYWREIIAADVLLLAHHGSKSSSSHTLLKWVDPTWALVSAGRGNRFGHPHPVVLERLRRRGGVTVFNTASAGAIQIRYPPNANPTISAQRDTATPYWLKLP